MNAKLKKPDNWNQLSAGKKAAWTRKYNQMKRGRKSSTDTSNRKAKPTKGNLTVTMMDGSKVKLTGDVKEVRLGKTKIY